LSTNFPLSSFSDSLFLLQDIAHDRSLSDLPQDVGDQSQLTTTKRRCARSGGKDLGLDTSVLVVDILRLKGLKVKYVFLCCSYLPRELKLRRAC
jgi:hypothetical protein